MIVTEAICAPPRTMTSILRTVFKVRTISKFIIPNFPANMLLELFFKRDKIWDYRDGR